MVWLRCPHLKLRASADRKDVLLSGAVGGKTGKTSVLPRFSKIERGGGAQHWWSYLVLAHVPRRRRRCTVRSRVCTIEVHCTYGQLNIQFLWSHLSFDLLIEIALIRYFHLYLWWFVALNSCIRCFHSSAFSQLQSSYGMITFCTFGHSTYRCGNYSREETIQGRKLFAEIRYPRSEWSNQTHIKDGFG